MKNSVLLLSARLLEMAGDKFANHGCNDLSESFWEGLSLVDRKVVYAAYHAWNDDPDQPFDPDGYRYLGDDTLMSFFSDVLKEMMD